MFDPRFDPPRSARGTPQPDAIRWFFVYTSWTTIYGFPTDTTPVDQSCVAKHAVWHSTRGEWISTEQYVTLYDPSLGNQPAIGDLVRAHFNPINQHWEIWNPPTDGILFRNDSSETVPAYGVLRITGGFTEGTGQVVTINKPNTDFKRIYLVNTSNTVAAGARGVGTWLSDAGYALYDTGTPAVGESWGPKASQWSLAKWRYGFTIIGTTNATGPKVWAKQEEVNEFIGKTDSSHAKNATGTVSIYDGNFTDTTDNMASVENKFAAVGSGKWVGVRWWGGKWNLTAAEC